jgi:hypothetical protein
MCLPELTDRMRSEEINTFFATSAPTSRAMSGPLTEPQPASDLPPHGVRSGWFMAAGFLPTWA